MKTLPIHLDHLTKALEDAGIRIKRNKAIEIAAAAFGFRASNTLVAAGKAGTLPAPVEAPPPSKPWTVPSGTWTAKDELVLGEQARPSIFNEDGDCMGAVASEVYLDPTDDYVDPISMARGHLFAAAPNLRDAIEDLLDWERAMGGFDSPAWNRARETIAELRKASTPHAPAATPPEAAIDVAERIIDAMGRAEIIAELDAMGEGDIEDESTAVLRTTLLGCLRQDGDAEAFVRERQAKHAAGT